MPRKVLVLTLISLLVLSVSVFGAMKPKVVDKVMQQRLEKIEKATYANENIVSKYITTPETKIMMPATGDTIGYTYYDYQHNDVQRRMIANDHIPQLHFCWMNLTGVGMDNTRYVDYNSWNPLYDPPYLFAGGKHVTTAAGRGGYTGLDILPDDREVLCYHRTLPTADPYPAYTFWGTTISIEDTSSGLGEFNHYDIADSVDGSGAATVKGEWPTVACAKQGTPNYIHITHAEGITSGGAVKRLGYVRCYEDASTASDTLICESPGWASVLKTPPNTRLSPNRIPYFFDSATLGGVSIATSPMSQKVAIVYLDNYVSGSNSKNNVKVIESTTNGSDWIANPATMVPVAITSYEIGEKARAYDDVATVYDYSDNLHIVWTTYNPTDANDVSLWHWCAATGVRKAGSATAKTTTDPGAWNLLIAKMTLGVEYMVGDAAYNYLYLNYTGFKDNDISADEMANGDLYLKASSNGGTTWGPAINLTNTNSDGCAEGDCESEHWSSIAERVDSFLYVQYIYDLTAGGVPQDEPNADAFTQNPVRWLKYARPMVQAIATMTLDPSKMITPYRTALNGGTSSENLLIDNVGTTKLYFKLSGPSWLTIVPTEDTIAEAGPTSTISLTFSGAGKQDTFMVDSIRVISNNGDVGENYTDTQWIKIHFVVTDTIYFAEWDTLDGGLLKAVVSNVGNIGNQTEDYLMNFKGSDFLFDFSPALVTPDVMGQGPVGFTWLHDHHDFLAEGNLIRDDSYPGVVVFYDKFGIPLPGRVPFHRQYWPWWGYWTKYSRIVIQPDYIGGYPTSVRPNWIRITNWWRYNPPPIWWDDIPGGYPTAPVGGYFGIVGDWDVPSDASGKNLGGYDTTLNLIYQYADTQAFEKYYGGFQFLRSKVSPATAYTFKPLGAHVTNNEEQLYPGRGYNDDSLLMFMSEPGWSFDSDSAQDMNIIMSMVQKLDPTASTVIELEYALLVTDKGLDTLKASTAVMYYSGDANGDWKVSVSDVVYIINYLFKQGPIFIGFSDVNNDSKVSVSDVVYLINYLFKQGPVPLPMPWQQCTQVPPW